ADQESPLFYCSVEGCVSTFQRHYNLERHLHYEKCHFLEEKHSLLDKAKMMAGHLLSPGWALSLTKKSSRFNLTKLNEKFKIGEQTGHKTDPEDVARDMRHAKEEDGSRMFTPAEFLSPQQIKSYFSRAAAKLRQSESCDDADECDVQAVEEEDGYSSVRSHIIQECQLVHPVMYDTYNLCEMCEQRKLTKLSVSMLHLICCYFDLKCEGVSLKRKAPYVKLIEGLVKSCSCN
ncbi:unnamed protein product, partial [Porites lobata]